MKKLVFAFVAIAAVSFASCGNKTAQAEAVDTAAVDTVEEVVDSITEVVDSVVAE